MPAPQSRAVRTALKACETVLGRKLEFAFVDRCLAQLEIGWGIKEWRGSFSPTRKNAQVADFWDRVGFSLLEETDTMAAYCRAAGDRHDNYSDVMSITEA